MDCTVTCLGKPGTTFNMAVENKLYLFKGGNAQTVNESVGRVLENIRSDKGSLLFFVEYHKPVTPTIVEAIDEVEEDVPEQLGITVDPSPRLPPKSKTLKKKQDTVI